MSEQDGKQIATLQRPTTSDTKTWREYWAAQGQPWRTEPEIDKERQTYLAERRTIVPNIEQGIYPFKDIKLSRADVEWLLATHENGHGPVEWSGSFQYKSEGLDLRGADLRRVDLHSLPLECMRGGLNHHEWVGTTLEQRNMAGVHLENTSLSFAHLRGAALSKAHLEGANLREAHLEGAELYRTHLEGAYLRKAHLGGASLRNALFDSTSIFDGVFLEDEKQGCALLADANWNGMNITNVNWIQIKMLGDDSKALKLKQWKEEVRNAEERLLDYQRAVRANRQLAAILQGQGQNEEAARFAYHSQKLQRVVLRKQKKFGSYFFSLFLDLLAGYGYRPGRSIFWYLVTILGFALAYFVFGHLPFLPDALIFSLTSFHGRGFFPGLGSENSLHNPLVIMAAFEAVIGLLIEISFIATFTQRFFGK